MAALFLLQFYVTQLFVNKEFFIALLLRGNGAAS